MVLRSDGNLQGCMGLTGSPEAREVGAQRGLIKVFCQGEQKFGNFLELTGTLPGEL